ncbi:Signal peptide peptidase-like 2B [Entomortierella beljakovae]|nr:Signal peptide peptidase-like 2B [Entomortierella beljakovae]
MKNLDQSLKTLDKEISADAKLTSAWGSTEGDDLADVCQRMSQLMEEVGLIQQAYSIRHTAYRKKIKGIKIQEMTLDDNRKKKQDLTSQIAKLQKSSKENPIKLMELQSALERVTAELLAQEMELMQFKRHSIKEAFDSKFDAMLEFAEKMALIAGYGRAITFVIDTDHQVADRMRIYNGAEYTTAAVNQVKAAVTNWQPQPSQSANPPVSTTTNVPANLPVRSQTVLSQDELAITAAAAACNSKTPPPIGQNYAANDGYSSSHNDGQDRSSDHASSSPKDDHGYASPSRNSHAEQLNQIHEQQRLLEQEQQRLFQHNLASYSEEPHTPAQQHYQVAAASGSNGGGAVVTGFSPSAPRRSGTQEIYSPVPVYETTPSGYGGFSQQQQQHNPQQYDQYGGQHDQYGGQHDQYGGQYDSSTYQNPPPARNYRLGFIDPRERSQMEDDRYKAEVNQTNRPTLPPLHFSQTVSVLTLSTLSAADTTIQERQEQRLKEDSGEAVALTKYHALGFGFVASIGLLAMWMWSDVLVYMSLFTFGIGSFVSIQQCMPGIMKKLGLGRASHWYHNTIAGLLVLMWFWHRNESCSWVFQDILGGFVITLMLRVLKATSMSTPTLLLLTAFIYDVFFVFVTPYLTKSGESIMEAAATGASMTVKETIPMLFRIPSFSHQGGEAMLGFGDVVLPGILVTFLKECDARLEEDQFMTGLDSNVTVTNISKSLPTPSCSQSCKKSWWGKRWSYHLTAIIGYALGLEVTFVAMMWMNKGQPALLYLVPFTVLPVIMLASKRHELSLLWNGWSELENIEESYEDKEFDGEIEEGKQEKETILM